MSYANRNHLKSNKFFENNRLRSQLVIRLKHHHRETLAKVPLEIAVNSMYKAWRACHPEVNEPFLSGVPTEINPKEHKLGSIAHHLYQ